MKFWGKKANYARSSICGILSYYGKKSLCDPFYKAMLPMGGGFGEGLVCGLVTGSLAALSLVLAEKGLNEEEITKKTDRWKDDFKKKFGTLICFELIDEYRNESDEIDFEMVGRHEKCTNVVILGVILAQQIIDSIE